jgi:hypothetical protein
VEEVTQPSKFEILTQRAAVELRSEWATFVELATSINEDAVEATAGALSIVSKVGADSIRRKLYAVQKIKRLGFSVEEIIAMGQEKVLGDVQRARRTESYRETVVMKWSIPGSLRELVSIQQKRIMALLQIGDSTGFWDWWVAQMRNASDEDILATKGEEENAPRSHQRS